jgi:Tfp pilus assembly protein PilO
MKYPRFIILTSLFGAILVGLMFTWPKYQEYLKIAKNLENKQNFFQNQSRYYKEIEDTFRKLEEKKEIVDKIESALPKKLDSSSLLNYLHKTTRINGLLLQEIRISGAGSLKEIERIKKHKITLTLVGSYASFKNFLQELEQSARLFEIERISFLSPQKEEAIYNFELQLMVYSY